MARKWPAFWLVVLVVFACFAPALRGGLLMWDDTGYVLENVRIRSLSIDTVVWAFTESPCNYWAPLTWLSFAVDHAIWGLAPFGYHLTNIVLHALAAGLFFLVALRLLERRTDPDGTSKGLDPDVAVPVAALAALLFGVHPLRVESVAWVTERKDVLSTVFGIGAVLAYLGHAAGDGHSSAPGARAGVRWSRALLLALLLHALSLLAKATFITLPFALLVLDWSPLRRLTSDRLPGVALEKLPMLAMAGGAAAITAQAMAPSARSLTEYDFLTRVLTAFTSIVRYLRLTVLPFDISPVYLHPGKTTLGFEHVLAIAVVAGITVWALRDARRRPAILAAWLLFLGTLFPVLGLAMNGDQELAPRFTHVPSLALSLLAALGFAVALERWGATPARRRLAWGTAAGVIVLFGAVTVRDIGFWRNDDALWSRVIELEPNRFGFPYAQRAYAREASGDLRGALADMDVALAFAERKRFAAIYEVYAHRARLRRAMGDTAGASADFGVAIERSSRGHRALYENERAALLGSGGPDPAGRTPDVAGPRH